MEQGRHTSDGPGKLGPDVWNSEGIKILGTPAGSDQFVADASQARLAEERRLCKAISWMPVTQYVWQILLQCAGPRCHHFLWTIPPIQSETYADGLDEGMWRAFEAGRERLRGEDRQKATALNISGLPIRMVASGSVQLQEPLLGNLGRFACPCCRRGCPR